jgi:hypothetical protein
MTIQDVKKYATNPAVLITILVAVLAIGIFINANTRAKLSAAQSELASSKALYSFIAKEKDRLDSQKVVLETHLVSSDSTISIMVLRDKEKDKNIALLQDSLKTNLIDVGKISADSSYSAINARIPATAPLSFPFDSNQVRKIHYTFVERDGLFKLTATLNGLVVDLKQTTSLKENQIADLNSLVNVYKDKESLYTNENTAYKKEIGDLNLQVKKQKTLKNVLIAPAAVGVATVVVFTIKAFTK